MRRVLITGAGGFLGRHLIRRLSGLGVQITTIGRTECARERHVALGKAPWTPSTLARIIEHAEPDVIFNLVGCSSGSSEELDEVNWGIATAFMRALSTLPRQPLFVCCGSAAEYGAAIVDGVPVEETAECLPLNPYGISKLAQTRSVLSFSADTGIPVLVARIFNPLGPGMPKHLALADFAGQIATIQGDGGRIQCGNLDVSRDYIDIEYVASTMHLLAKNPAARGVINVCSGEAVRLGDLTQMLVAASGKQMTLETVQDRVRPGEIDTIIGSTTLLERLGAKPPPTDYADAVNRIWHDVEKRARIMTHA